MKYTLLHRVKCISGQFSKTSKNKKFLISFTQSFIMLNIVNYIRYKIQREHFVWIVIYASLLLIFKDFIPPLINI